MAPLPAAEEELGHALRILEARSPYAEVMAETTDGLSLRLDRSSTTPEPHARLAGAVFRAWGDGGWRETAVSSLARGPLEAAARELADHLGTVPAGGGPPGTAATGRLERVTEERRPVRDFPLEERLELARTVFGWATSVEGVANAMVTLAHHEDERLFLSTAGSRCYQRMVRVRGTVVPIAIEGNKVEYDFVTHGGVGGREVLDVLTEAAITESAREARRLLNAAAPPLGRMTVILDPSTAGTFAHESFGHGTEADQLLRDRSYLKPLLGTVVGPECLTLVDDGSYPGGWGTIYFDDEGHPSQRTVLVDRGRFVEVLHDRESAAAMGRRATGNTRRADFLSRPFVRMTNTFVEPGDFRLDELVREAKEGVLLQGCQNGIEDPLGGNMQIKVKKARRIHGGELGEVLPSLALSGRVLDFLRSIRGVSRRDDFLMSPGYCGKGQTDLLPAGTGGSYLLGEAVVGPA